MVDDPHEPGPHLVPDVMALLMASVSSVTPSPRIGHQSPTSVSNPQGLT
jgi:hypothetical protein